MAEELKEAVKVKTATKTCTIHVRGQDITLDHAPTSADIEDIGFKHIGGKFHVYNEKGEMVRKSEFPFTGGALELREYHAPAGFIISASIDMEVAQKFTDDLKPGEKQSGKINRILRQHYGLDKKEK